MPVSPKLYALAQEFNETAAELDTYNSTLIHDPDQVTSIDYLRLLTPSLVPLAALPIALLPPQTHPVIGLSTLGLTIIATLGFVGYNVIRAANHLEHDSAAAQARTLYKQIMRTNQEIERLRAENPQLPICYHNRLRGIHHSLPTSSWQRTTRAIITAPQPSP